MLAARNWKSVFVSMVSLEFWSNQESPINLHQVGTCLDVAKELEIKLLSKDLGWERPLESSVLHLPQKLG